MSERSPPSVGVVTHNVDPGGAQRIAIREAALLGERGYDVTLYSLIKPRDPWVPLLSDVRLEYVVDVGDALVGEALSRALSAFASLPGGCDLHVCHNLPGAQLGHRAWRRRGTPYVAYVHDASAYPVAGSPFTLLFGRYSPDISREELGLLGRAGLTLERRWLGGARAVLANADRTARDLDRRHGIAADVLYPTLVGDVDGVTATDREPFFLVVQRLDPHPTYDVLERLLDRVRDLRVVVAGSESAGYLAARLRRRFDAYGDRVRFVVDPTDETLADLYASARAYLQPGVENFNMSALEAASTGCPVVLAAESGITELFGDYPLFVPANDVGGFEAAVRRLQENPEEARRLGQRAASVAGAYDDAYHVETLEATLSRHLDGGVEG